jgi:hypothetical protein
MALPVILSIGSLPAGGDTLTGFRFVWLWYVRGFKPQHHCQRSLLGKPDVEFLRWAYPQKRIVGRTFELHLPHGYRQIYLCAEASVPDSGLHLSMEPVAGASFSVETYNGVLITVTNARRLEIPPLPDGYLGYPHAYTSCCNWQFGVKYYGLAVTAPAAERVTP